MISPSSGPGPTAAAVSVSVSLKRKRESSSQTADSPQPPSRRVAVHPSASKVASVANVNANANAVAVAGAGAGFSSGLTVGMSGVGLDFDDDEIDPPQCFVGLRFYLDRAWYHPFLLARVRHLVHNRGGLCRIVGTDHGTAMAIDHEHEEALASPVSASSVHLDVVILPLPDSDTRLSAKQIALLARNRHHAWYSVNGVERAKVQVRSVGWLISACNEWGDMHGFASLGLTPDPGLRSMLPLDLGLDPSTEAPPSTLPGETPASMTERSRRSSARDGQKLEWIVPLMLGKGFGTKTAGFGHQRLFVQELSKHIRPDDPFNVYNLIKRHQAFFSVVFPCVVPDPKHQRRKQRPPPAISLDSTPAPASPRESGREPSAGSLSGSIGGENRGSASASGSSHPSAPDTSHQSGTKRSSEPENEPSTQRSVTVDVSGPEPRGNDDLAPAPSPSPSPRAAPSPLLPPTSRPLVGPPAGSDHLPASTTRRARSASPAPSIERPVATRTPSSRQSSSARTAALALLGMSSVSEAAAPIATSEELFPTTSTSARQPASSDKSLRGAESVLPLDEAVAEVSETTAVGLPQTSALPEVWAPSPSPLPPAAAGGLGLGLGLADLEGHPPPGSSRRVVVTPVDLVEGWVSSLWDTNWLGARLPRVSRKHPALTVLVLVPSTPTFVSVDLELRLGTAMSSNADAAPTIIWILDDQGHDHDSARCSEVGLEDNMHSESMDGNWRYTLEDVATFTDDINLVYKLAKRTEIRLDRSTLVLARGRLEAGWPSGMVFERVVKAASRAGAGGRGRSSPARPSCE